jgi:glycosyltransferase involved in cell wall biosynthesis
LILPSANEGTPVVAIESLAAQRPVVATRVGGVPDVVTDGEDGILVEPGDIAALGRALAAVASDPYIRARLGRAGSELVVPRYRVDRLVDDVDRLYRELLTEQRLPLPSS